MNESLYIVTGTSHGMGAAMAQQLLQARHVVLGISRHVNDALDATARDSGATFAQWPRDLAEPVPVAAELEDWLRGLDAARFARATLINNAAMLTRVGPADECSNAELSMALRVGLEAPVLLTASFLRATRGWPAMQRGEVKVLNISSGLGRRAMAGSASYCATKAGMDNFSRAAALDEAHRGRGAKIVALAPGVIETGMQAHLRAADGAGFPDQAFFFQLQRSGQLATPQDAAARVLAFLDRPDFGTNALADVRDA